VIDENNLTKEQWSVCGSPEMMINFLEGKTNRRIERELLHFSYACCGRLERYIPAKRRQCLRVIRQWTEGKVTAEELETAILKDLRGWEPPKERNSIVREMVADALYAFFKHRDDPLQLARTVVSSAQQALWHSRGKDGWHDERTAQATLLKDAVSFPRNRARNHKRRKKGTP
jgi:hypothetical protein